MSKLGFENYTETDRLISKFNELVKAYNERKEVVENLLKIYGREKVGFVDFFEDVKGDEVPVSVPPDVWVYLSVRKPESLGKGSYLLIGDTRTLSLILGTVKEVVRPRPLQVTSTTSLGVETRFDTKQLVRPLRLVVRPMVSVRLNLERAKELVNGLGSADEDLYEEALNLLESAERSAPRAPPDQLSPVYLPNKEVISALLGLRGEVTFGSLGVLDQPLEGVPVAFGWRDVMVKHVLVTGTTGSGKTSFLKNLLWDVKRNSPTAFQIIIDANGDFAIANFPGYVRPENVTRRVLKALRAYGIEGEVGKPLPLDNPCEFKLNNLVVVPFSLTDTDFLDKFFNYLRTNRVNLYGEIAEKLFPKSGKSSEEFWKYVEKNLMNYVYTRPTLLLEVLNKMDEPRAVELFKEISRFKSIETLKSLLDEAKGMYEKLGAKYKFSYEIVGSEEGAARAKVRVDGCEFEVAVTARTFVLPPTAVTYLVDFYPFFSEQAASHLYSTINDVVDEILNEVKRSNKDKAIILPSEILERLEKYKKEIHTKTFENIQRGFRNLEKMGIFVSINTEIRELLGLELFTDPKENVQGLYDLAEEVEASGIVLDLENVDKVQKSFAGLILIDTLVNKIEKVKNPEYALVAIDEAHLFFPAKEERSSYEARLENMIHRLLRLGRRRGVSVVLSTHRPGDLSSLVLSLTNTKLYFRNDAKTVENLEIPKEYAENLPYFDDYAAVLESYKVLGGFVTLVNGPSLVGHKTV